MNINTKTIDLLKKELAQFKAKNPTVSLSNQTLNAGCMTCDGSCWNTCSGTCSGRCSGRNY